MDRRWSGAFIVALVLLAAAVVPVAIAGRHVAGVPVAQYVPPPPAVGDCVGDASPPSLYDNSSYVPLILVACTGRRAGEVVTSFPDKRVASAGAIDGDPNQDACAAAIPGYLGQTLGPADAAAWELPTFLTTLIGMPSTLQSDAGQHWVACVLVLVGPDQDLVSWNGTAKNALAPDAEPPPAFATCLKMSSIIDYERIDCASPHAAEAFGLMSTNHAGLTQELLDTSCRAEVLRRTRMADPTAGGRLSIKAVTVHGADGPPVAGLGSATDDTGFAMCEVVTTARHSLTGALLGLGTAPAPVSN